MTEPKRWTVPGMEPQYMGDDEHGEPRYYNPAPPIEVVAAADFDRLRDERDEMIRVSAANIATTQRNMDELRRVAGVLADAARHLLDPDGSYSEKIAARHGLRSALAVFDTLTEEKT